MKKLKENKGITLVALIITIIVLLILAVVTISAVNEGSLFAHANNAATAYSAAAGNENTMISNYLSELEKHDSTAENQQGGGNNQQTPASRSDIVGTYYAVNGDTSLTIEIGETTLSIVGETVTPTYSNNTITATLECLGEVPLVLTYSELPNGTKTLYSTTGYGVPMLYATNISGLATDTMTGKYAKDSNHYYEFISATTVHRKDGSEEVDRTYTYFSDFDIICSGTSFFKLEGNVLNKLNEGGTFTAYTLES